MCVWANEERVNELGERPFAKANYFHWASSKINGAPNGESLHYKAAYHPSGCNQ